MRKELICVLLFICTLTACSNKNDNIEIETEMHIEIEETEKIEGTAEAESIEEVEGTAEMSEGAEATSEYADGSPWMASHIDGVLTEETEISLKDDFYASVNKETILNLKYTPGNNDELILSLNDSRVRDNKLELLNDESLKSHEAELVRTYYKLLNDWDDIEKSVDENIKTTLGQINGISSMGDYIKLMEDWDSLNDVPSMLSIGATRPSYDTSTWIAFIDGPSLMLGDPDEYKSFTEYGEIIYKYRKEQLEYTASALGMNKEIADFDKAMEFERRLADHAMGYAEQYTAEAVEKMDNYFTIDEVDELLGDGINIKEFIETNKLESDKYRIYQVDYVKFIGALLNDEENLDELKNWLRVRYLIDIAGNRNKEDFEYFMNLYYELFNIEVPDTYETILMETTENVLSTPMQVAYVEKYQNSKMREDVYKLCEDIISEYKEMLQNVDWMEDETKAKAIEKLDSIKIHSLYPDKFPDYSSLSFDGMNLTESAEALERFEIEELRKKLSTKAVDPDIWYGLEWTPITESNAFYDSEDNSINILLGIMGEELYHDGISKEELYGGLGTVIAHEISHAFDSNGSQYNKDGALENWWTDSDKKKFDSKIDSVINYLDGITIYGDNSLDGSMMDSEYTADWTAINCLLGIASKDTEFDYDKFFRQYAYIWASKATLERVNQLYAVDPHPPVYVRVNAVLNQFDDFYKTYDIEEGDNMYIAPEKRIKIW